MTFENRFFKFFALENTITRKIKCFLMLFQKKNPSSNQKSPKVSLQKFSRFKSFTRKTVYKNCYYLYREYKFDIFLRSVPQSASVHLNK